MTQGVYDFTQGDKDQKELFAGNGANLTEMTGSTCRVPPGFTFTTQAYRQFLQLGDELPRCGSRSPRRRGSWRISWVAAWATGTTHCWSVSAPARSFRCRDDVDRPERRPQRRLGQGAGRGVGQRTVRLGLLPAATADDRRDRVGHLR